MAKNEAKIKFNAEVSGFNQDIRKANNEMAELRSELNLNEAQMKETGDSTDGLKNKHGILAKQLKATQDKTEALNEKVKKAEELFGENSEEASKLRIQLNNARTAETKLEKALADCEKELKGSDEAFEEAEESAGKFGETLKELGGGACKVVGAGIAGVAAAAAGAVTAFLGSAEATREYRESQGKLDAAFQAAGKSAKSAENTYDELFRVIGEGDQSVEAAQQIALLADSEQNAAKWADYASGVVGKFGDALQPETFFESANETMKLGEATGAYTQMLEGCGMDVENFNKGLAACKTEEEKQAYMLGITEQALGSAGDAYEKLNKDILDANDSIANMDEAMGNIGAAAEPVMTTLRNMGAGILTDLTPAVALIGEGMTGALNGTEGATSTLAEGIGGAMNTVVTKIGDVLGMAVKILPDLFVKMTPVFINGIVKLVSSIAQAAPQIVDAIMSMLPALLEGIESISTSIIEALPAIMESICSALPTLIPMLIDTVCSLILTIVDNIQAIIQPIIDCLPDVIIAVVDAIVSNLPALIDGIIQLVLGIVQEIPTIVQSLVDAIPTIVEMLVTSILQNTPKIIAGIAQVIWEIVKSLPTICKSLVQGLKNVFIGAWNGIKNVFSNSAVGNWFKNVFTNAKNLVMNVWSSITGFFKNIWSGISSAFSSVGSWFSTKFTAAKNAVSTAFSGVKNAASSAWSGIKNTFSNIGGWFKDKFNAVKTNIMNIWKGIKLKLPDIKLPHFKVSGKFSLNPISVPKLSISWYKEGAIFTKPTLFDTAFGLKGVGEAGAEAVLPIEKLEGFISNAIEKAQGVANLNSLANAIDNLANRPIRLNINGREFALATASDTDRVGGMRTTFKSRGLALN